MQGTIKTYLPEKHYGFIKGQDGKDYFFHESAFADKGDIHSLAEGVLIDFDQKATPKGYQAIKCKVLTKLDDMCYITPDKFLTTKSAQIKGWEMIEMGGWVVSGTSAESPDAAKDEAIAYAKQVGANALVELRYGKSTGSQPSDSGKGTYYFSIHHFRGRIATVARRHADGKQTLDSLQGLNQRALTKFEKLKSDREQDQKIALYTFIGTCVLSALCTARGDLAWLVVLAIGAITSSWLYPRGEIWLKRKIRS